MLGPNIEIVKITHISTLETIKLLLKLFKSFCIYSFTD